MENYSHPARVIDHLAVLSSIRDRDALLRRLTLAWAETVAARSVEIYAVVQDDDQRYWLALIKADCSGNVQVLSDPLWTDLSVLAPIYSETDRLHRLDRVEMINITLQSPQSGSLTRFPGDSERWRASLGGC